MPLLLIDYTPGAMPSGHRQAFVEAITDAACAAESLPQDQAARQRCIVILKELASGEIFWGGTNADQKARGFFATFYASAGVLDAARREAFVRAFEKAAQAEGDPRLTITSVMLTDVPEGMWGRSGTIVRLPQMAQAAGFGHLAEIARP
jgi:phenylpyruvate tautomerase PptA (4-oxalocrotonate tautomerase family)